VHLKSLTLKGFKSFASATTLRLEPGDEDYVYAFEAPATARQ